MGVVVVVILLTFYSPAVCVTDVTEIVRIKKKTTTYNKHVMSVVFCFIHAYYNDLQITDIVG